MTIKDLDAGRDNSAEKFEKRKEVESEEEGNFARVLIVPREA